jgi:hypothetical protein
MQAVELQEYPYTSREAALFRAFGSPRASLGQNLSPRVGVMRVGSSSSSTERITQDGMTLQMLMRELAEEHYSVLGALHTDHIEEQGVHALYCVSLTLYLRKINPHIDRGFIRYFAVNRWLGGRHRSGPMVEWVDVLDVPDSTLCRWNASIKDSLDALRDQAEIKADDLLKVAGLIGY